VTDPSPADTGVVANPASGDAWTLTLLRAAWPIEGAVLLVVSVLLLFAAPERMGAWMAALPILAGIVAAQGAAAFGGPALKRSQEARNGRA